MLDSSEVKRILLEEGADLCGIAPVDRFAEAPRGFHPSDIYEDCHSVVAFARRLPAGILFAHSRVPYTRANDQATAEVDSITFRAALRLEDAGVRCVIIPSDDPVEHWEAERLRAQGILSLRHAGLLAGLGVLGRNTLLVNERFGNMIQLGAILVDRELEGDPPADYAVCASACGMCIESCPAQALDGITVDQARCRPVSMIVNARGHAVKGCYACRSACPNALGLGG